MLCRMNEVSKIIDQLGGTAKVARLCGIKPPSVSEWKARNVIPKGQRNYLRLLRPDLDWSAIRTSTNTPAPEQAGELGEEAA